MTSTIFVTYDVAIVHFLSVMPLATLLATKLQQRCSRKHQILVALLSPAMSLLLIPAGTGERGDSFAAVMNASLLRTVAVLGPALVAVLLATSVVCRPQPRKHSWGTESISALGCRILVLAILPAVYIQARCRHDAAILGELLEQSRLGEARAQVRELIALASPLQYRGRSLQNLALEIDCQVRDLESRIAEHRADSATAEQSLEQCRRLAMLGRVAEALDGLRALLDSPVGPAACELCGSIYETTAQWETARDYHRRAKAAWHGWPSGSERRAGFLRAATRLGYCERKLGRYDLAEVEYREVLALSPTADNHFLLARFYEDMQQSAKARAHARRAMALAPQRYSREGIRLIDKLMVSHFGCLSVYSAERGERLAAP